MDNSDETHQLMIRISDMRKSIDELKFRIQLERNYIDHEKSKLQETHSQSNWSTPMTHSTHSSSFRPKTSQSTAQFSDFGKSLEQRDGKEPLFLLQKQSLRDIDEKCETELMKLNRYIDSIKELKKFWQNAIIANTSEGFKEATTTAQSIESERIFEGTPNYLKS